jgi:hypothetical protein
LFIKYFSITFVENNKNTMPTFYTEDIDIDPDEFVSSCNSREIEELIDALVEDGHITKPGNHIPENDKNLMDEEWDEVIGKISGRARLRLTNEEEEIIKKIANRL